GPDGAGFVDANGDPVTIPNTVVQSGVATFSGVRLNKVGAYTLGVQAVDNDVLTNGTSNAFAVTAAAPTGPAFQIQRGYSDPANFISAYNPRTYSSWPGIVVQVVDKFNNQVTDPTVLKALINGTGGTPGSVMITAKNSGGTAIKFADGTDSKTA